MQMKKGKTFLCRARHEMAVAVLILFCSCVSLIAKSFQLNFSEVTLAETGYYDMHTTTTSTTFGADQAGGGDGVWSLVDNGGWANGVDNNVARAHSSLSKFSHESLPSGWDNTGQELYHETKMIMAHRVTRYPNSILTHQILPLAPVRTAHRWFRSQFTIDGKGPSKWEPGTFETFFRYISSCRYYVEFGSWIGPTLFYAAQMVDEAFAIEADPADFANVETHLA